MERVGIRDDTDALQEGIVGRKASEGRPERRRNRPKMQMIAATDILDEIIFDWTHHL
jgi:hypothetical protein